MEEDRFFTKSSVIKAAILGAFLLFSIIFLGTSWNTGRYLKVSESIAYEVHKQDDPELLEGREYILQAGQAGTRVSYYEDVGGKQGKLLYAEVTVDPIENVVAVGKKPRSDVKREARACMQSYCDAWKAGDTDKLYSLSSREFLQGAAVQDIQEAYTSSKERLASYQIVQQDVYSQDEWIQLVDKRGSYGGKEILADPPSSGQVEMMCEVELKLSLASDYYGAADLAGLAYLVFEDGVWKVQHLGPLKLLRVGEAKDYVRDRYGYQEHVKVTLESIILYGGRFSVLMSEESLTQPGNSSYYSDDSRLDNAYVEVKGSSLDFDEVNGLSTDFSYSLQPGQSQRGLVTCEPALSSGNSVVVKAGEAVFAPVIVP